MEMNTVLRDSSQLTQNDSEPVMQLTVAADSEFCLVVCFFFNVLMFIFKLLTCVNFSDDIFRQNLFFFLNKIQNVIISFGKLD